MQWRKFFSIKSQSGEGIKFFFLSCRASFTTSLNIHEKSSLSLCVMLFENMGIKSSKNGEKNSTTFFYILCKFSAIKLFLCVTFSWKDMSWTWRIKVVESLSKFLAILLYPGTPEKSSG